MPDREIKSATKTQNNKHKQQGVNNVKTLCKTDIKLLLQHHHDYYYYHDYYHYHYHYYYTISI